MTKHILDRPRNRGESDLAKAVQQAEKAQPHRATLALQQRSRLRDPAHRQAEYLRIARTEAAQQP